MNYQLSLFKELFTYGDVNKMGYNQYYYVIIISAVVVFMIIIIMYYFNAVFTRQKVSQ